MSDLTGTLIARLREEDCSPRLWWLPSDIERIIREVVEPWEAKLTEARATKDMHKARYDDCDAALAAERADADALGRWLAECIAVLPDTGHGCYPKHHAKAALAAHDKRRAGG